MPLTCSNTSGHVPTVRTELNCILLGGNYEPLLSSGMCSLVYWMGFYPTLRRYDIITENSILYIRLGSRQ
jgi:hypothetical protein